VNTKFPTTTNYWSSQWPFWPNATTNDETNDETNESYITSSRLVVISLLFSSLVDCCFAAEMADFL
jgi:hypothetical protein